MVADGRLGFRPCGPRIVTVCKIRLLLPLARIIVGCKDRAWNSHRAGQLWRIAGLEHRHIVPAP